MYAEVANLGNAGDMCAGADWVELFNSESKASSLVGMVLVDDNGLGDSSQLVLGSVSCPQTLAPGAYVLYCRDGDAHVGAVPYVGCGFAFGLGSSDTAFLYSNASSGELVDSTPGCCAASGMASFGRLPDGTGGFAVLATRTPGAANLMHPPSVPPPPRSPPPPSAPKSLIVINEVADLGNAGDVCAGADWVELFNDGPAATSLANVVLAGELCTP